MKKPCNHDGYIPECRVCWLSVHDRRYRALWGKPNVPALQCVHLGAATGAQVKCTEGCGKGTLLKVYNCTEFGVCTIGKRGEGVLARCKGCDRFSTEKPGASVIKNKWACGITTVPERAELFNRTVASIAKAGFPDPQVFMDAEPRLRVHGRWVLGAMELFIRNPTATHYAMFQDDVVFSRNVRQYLDATPYPGRGYLNLSTFYGGRRSNNENVIRGKPVGWYESDILRPGPEGYQCGHGAIALVFDREALMTVLSSRHMIERPLDADRGWQAIDGGIVTAMNKAGFREYIHNPSLCQHTGNGTSTIGHGSYRLPETFKGTEFDAMELLNASAPVPSS